MIQDWYDNKMPQNDFLDNAPNQPFKYITKTWVKINDDFRGTRNNNSQIKFKTKNQDC